MITVRVHLTAWEGKRFELIQTINELKDKIAAEKGCIQCCVCQNTDNRNQFTILQKWETEKLARIHLDSENFAVMVGAGSVLAHEVSISLEKERSINILEARFNERIIKNG